MRAFILGLLLVTLGCGCSKSEQKESLQIAVSANLQYAAGEIVAAYTSSTQQKVNITLGSSGKLTTQISQGAPFHIFLSADSAYPQSLITDAKAIEPLYIYAYGDLAIWSYRDDLPMHDPKLCLSYPSVRAIGVANPDIAPYGRLSKNWLLDQQLWDSLETNIVYGESIGQINQYITSGVVDVGITSLSSVMHEYIGAKGRWARLSLTEDKLLAQAAVITSYGQEKLPKASKKFMAFLKNEQSQQILNKYGYLVK